MTQDRTPTVSHVAADGRHRFSKPTREVIRLIEGEGVEGDAHRGVTVKHRSRVRADPTQPNLRQVHLIHGELHDELVAKGFDVAPGVMGENVTTRGLDLLSLPRGTVLRIGSEAEVEITGLRNPCSQIEKFQTGLLKAVLDRAEDGSPILKSGIMAIVRASGEIRPGDAITVTLPPEPHVPLERV